MSDAATALVGAWEVLGGEDIDDHGGLVHAAEPRTGRLIYTANGLVSVVSTPAVRNRIACVAPRPVIVGASDRDLQDAVTGWAAYAGQYRVAGDTVVNIVEVALNPNAIG